MVIGMQLNWRLVVLLAAAIIGLMGMMVFGWTSGQSNSQASSEHAAAVASGARATNSGPTAADVKVAGVVVTPADIDQLDVLTISTRLRNSGGQVDNVTVELDVYNDQGQAVLHERQSGLALYSGGAQSVYWEWRVPQRVTAGDYRVGVAVYDTASKKLLARQDQGAMFTVSAR